MYLCVNKDGTDTKWKPNNPLPPIHSLSKSIATDVNKPSTDRHGCIPALADLLYFCYTISIRTAYLYFIA
jgi:hypothetical protein